MFIFISLKKRIPFKEINLNLASLKYLTESIDTKQPILQMSKLGQGEGN